jgi:rod shape-determining protein MreD
MSPRLGTVRAVLLAAVVVTAVVLQVSVFSQVAWRGVAPDLVLLVVVAAGLARGSHTGLVTGFAGGVLLDLAPPADHVAGRWALALLVVGYVAGRVRPEPGDGRPPVVLGLATVGACAFLGSSLFALSGIVLRDPALGVGDLLPVVLAAVVWDVALAPFVLPPVLRLLREAEPDRERERISVLST